MALVGAGDNSRWAAWLPRRRRQDFAQRSVIVPVDFDDRPSEGKEFVRQRLKITRVRHGGTLLEAVAIDDEHESIESSVGSDHHRLPVGTLLQFTIADDDEGTPGRALQVSGDGHAHTDGQPVTQRTGARLDSLQLGARRVAVAPRRACVCLGGTAMLHKRFSCAAGRARRADR